MIIILFYVCTLSTFPLQISIQWSAHRINVGIQRALILWIGGCNVMSGKNGLAESVTVSISLHTKYT